MATGSKQYQYIDSIIIGVAPIRTDSYIYITDDIVALTYSMKDSEPSDWSITIDNSTGKYTRGLSVSDPRYTSVNPMLEPVKKYKWMFSYTVKTDIVGEPGETFTHNFLSPTRYNTVSNSTGGYDVVISGTDNSWLLFQENQTMPTWRSTGVSTVTSSTVLSAIATKFGITIDSSAFQHFTINTLHMHGELPIDIVKEVLGVRWAKWRINPITGVLVIYNSPENGLADMTTDWVVTDRETIENLSYSIERFSTCTEITVRRCAPGSMICFEEEGNNTEEHKVNFNADFAVSGAVNVNIVSSCVAGEIKNLYLFTEAGGSGYYAQYNAIGGGNAWRCAGFYFEPTSGLGPEDPQPYYHIIGRGTHPGVGGIEPDPLFYVRWRNQTLRDWMGEDRPAKEPLINSLIPSNTDCDKYAQAALIEAASRFEVINGTIGFHPLMVPGDIIEITEKGCGFESKKFYVISVNQDICAGSTTFTAKRYRPTTILGNYTGYVAYSGVSGYVSDTGFNGYPANSGYIGYSGYEVGPDSSAYSGVDVLFKLMPGVG